MEAKRAMRLKATVAYPPTVINASLANGESNVCCEVYSNTPTGCTKTTSTTAIKKERTKKSKTASFEVRNRTIAGKLKVWSVFILCDFYPK